MAHKIMVVVKDNIVELLTTLPEEIEIEVKVLNFDTVFSLDEKTRLISELNDFKNTDKAS